jgi:hypothetical protein
MQLLLAHLVGDYLFQNRWMALNKRRNAWICFLHSTIYALSVALICGWWDERLLLVLFSHDLIDYFRIGALWSKYIKGETELPWTILSDNTMHLLILWGLSLI